MVQGKRQAPRGRQPSGNPTAAGDAGADGLRMRAVLPSGRCRGYLLRGGEEVREVCAGLNFPRDFWADLTSSAAVALERLPLVVVPLRPSAPPPELDALPTGARLVYRDAAHEWDEVRTKEKAAAIVRARIERVAAGRLSARELAAEIAAGSDLSRGQAFDMVAAAVQGGDLPFYSRRAKMRVTWGDLVRLYGALVDEVRTALEELGNDPEVVIAVGDANAWLERRGATVRLPIPLASTGGTVPPSSEPRRARGVLRSQQQQDAVIAAIQARGLDPLQLPSYKGTNRRGGLKAELAGAVGLTTHQMGHAWAALREDGRLRYVDEGDAGA